MLVLSRQRDQSIMIGDDIDITVVDIRGDKVRLGINAPRNVSVHRKEVFEQIRAENQKASQLQPGQLPGIADKAVETPAMKIAAPAIRLAVLISGGGTTLQNLIDQIAGKKLKAEIGVVIASKPGIAGIERAHKAGLKTVVIDRKQAADMNEYSRRVFAEIDAAKVDLVCLGGWLTLLDIPAKYAGKVMNIHPALLPSFGGKGLYGGRVHQAVLDAGCKVSGCTVHFVDATYDTGPIILQRCCPVTNVDTADTLAHRVFEEEKLAYPQAIELFRQKRLKIDGRLVIVE
jgi:formyltetrahydrofolate-dependent phosphoribosylglycinamide formyltransferase/carbon storage regulator CsrA